MKRGRIDAVLSIACRKWTCPTRFSLRPLPALSQSAGKGRTCLASIRENVQPTTSDSEQAARLSLQEVELDYQLGNIAEADYRTLRERYMRRALVAMKSRYGNAPNATGHGEDENELDTGDAQIIQDGQDTDLDALIEEQVRKLREMHRGDDDE